MPQCGVAILGRCVRGTKKTFGAVPRADFDFLSFDFYRRKRKDANARGRKEVVVLNVLLMVTGVPNVPFSIPDLSAVAFA